MVTNTEMAAESKTLQLMIYGEHSVPLRGGGGGHRPHPTSPLQPLSSLTTDTRPLCQINNQWLLGVVLRGELEKKTAC